MYRNCYNCPRKTECYTELGLEKLNPDYNFNCGALYTDYDEAIKLIHIIGEAIEKRSKYIQKQIFEYIADQCNSDVYNVKAELFDLY